MKSCPIIYKKVDQNAARVLAGLVTTLGILFIQAPQLSIVLILVYDFSIRVSGYPKMSILFHISKFLAKFMKLKKQEVDAGPKVFASKLGFLFVISILVAFLFGYALTSVLLMGALAACAFLEAAFAFCIGCEIYAIFHKLIHKVLVREFVFFRK
ncbi:DUF4395 domain-containing protein [bacterium]|nr:DUF4395 domain-containing protein [bacterium]MBU1994724.1 DUF4395 domain-containing protein [bacterium]